jgi:hypothetical protein
MILCFALEEALEYYARERLTFEAGFLMNMIRTKKKPEQCPECGSWRIAGILYGEPSINASVERDLEAEKMVLG